MDNKAFCDHCNLEVEYVIKTEKKDAIYKSEPYDYVSKTVKCKECGHILSISSIDKENEKALADEIRRKHNLVSLEIIMAIPEKYSIGKRPLSLLLGWGEQTFSRYYEGDLPSKQYSDILLKIYENPEFYKELLESKKDNLKTKCSYEKSRKAVDELILKSKKGTSKIYEVSEYLLSKCEDITPLALQKALYYIQGFHYAFYNKFIFEEDCKACIYGPIYKEVYRKYKEYRFNPSEERREFDTKIFSSAEKGTIDSVINYVCCYSGKMLEKFTRSEKPWLLARGELADKQETDDILAKELIGDYFKDIKQKYNMINPNDIKEYMKDLIININ